ncbi:MAG: helix-turn-helix domain-containing protein [Candidatus Berkelbacteria bacterium]
MKMNLESFGLNETEQAIYLAGLALGPTSVQSLSRTANTKRSTSYFAIENLIEKGFFRERKDAKKRTLIAENPKHLNRIIRKEELALQQKKSSLEQLMPQLEAIATNTTDHSSIDYYEGKEGVWHVFENMLKEKADIFWLGNFGAAIEHLDLSDLLINFSKKRRQFYQNKSYIICSSHALAQKLWELEDTDFREFRFIETSKTPQSAIAFQADNTTLFSFGTKISATVYHNREIAGLITLMFDALWKTSSKTPKFE